MCERVSSLMFITVSLSDLLEVFSESHLLDTVSRCWVFFYNVEEVVDKIKFSKYMIR